MNRKYYHYLSWRSGQVNGGASQSVSDTVIIFDSPTQVSVCLNGYIS